jgi:hypothetical protein
MAHHLRNLFEELFKCMYCGSKKMNDSECISSIVDEKKINEFQSFG